MQFPPGRLSSDQVNRLGLYLPAGCYRPQPHHYLLLLLILKARAHFTVPRTVDG